MEKIKKLAFINIFVISWDFECLPDIINPDLRQIWIMNLIQSTKKAQQVFKGELNEIVVDISEQRLYLVKNKKIY